MGLHEQALMMPLAITIGDQALMSLGLQRAAHLLQCPMYPGRRGLEAPQNQLLRSSPKWMQQAGSY